MDASMNPPTCFITIGHAHAGDNAGASYEGCQEVALVRVYVAALQVRLLTLGWRVEIGDKNRYSADKARADEIGAHVYINAHLNAGMSGRRSQRGEIFYDYRSAERDGHPLAAEVARQLDLATINMPVNLYKTVPKACRPDTNGVPRDGDYSEAYSCIAGVRAVAICTEPFFIDGGGRDYLRLPSGLAQIGTAIADGVHAWYTARGGA
jgi:N-acetylmuramoyl-L-alanine amidase